MKKYVALVLSLAMALSLCVPAWAEGAAAQEDVEKCTGDSHLAVMVKYSGDKATNVYCDNCGITFGFVQGTEDDAKNKFGVDNYKNAENDVWYTLKNEPVVVPPAPIVPPTIDIVVSEPNEAEAVVSDNADALKEEISASATDTTTISVVDDAGKTTTVEFTESGKLAFASATDISTELTIVETPVTEDVAEKVMEKIGKDTDSVVYLDISINIYADATYVGQLTEMSNVVTITIDIDDLGLEAVEFGYTRNFYVVRIHNGVAEKLSASVLNNKLSFSSDKYSVYAIVYEDVPTSYGWGGYYPVVDGTTTSKPVDSPKTFDAGIALYVGMSVMGAVGTVALGKKRED